MDDGVVIVANGIELHNPDCIQTKGYLHIVLSSNVLVSTLFTLRAVFCAPFSFCHV
mgnify:CR=1 FL=1